MSEGCMTSGTEEFKIKTVCLCNAFAIIEHGVNQVYLLSPLHTLICPTQSYRITLFLRTIFNRLNIV